MKKVIFNDPKNEKTWENFELELSNLAKKHGIVLLKDSFINPVLVTLHWGGGRGFDGITESFVVSKEMWDNVKPIFQKHEIYFGEIAGKHSEIYGKLEDQDITEIMNEKTIQSWISLHGKHEKENHAFSETLLQNLQENGNNDDADVLLKFVESLT